MRTGGDAPHLPATLVGRLERLIFGQRIPILVLFALGTLVLGLTAVRGLRIDTSFNKTLPVHHEYMRTYLDPRVAEFRGADRVLIALIARDGNMFTPQFFAALRRATDEVVVMDGIDRTQVQSIFTPNVRYLEVVEDGIEAGNVIPADFTPTPESMARVRDNIRKAGIIGRLVANDFSGALVSAIVLDTDAQGKPVDPIRVARELERRVRAPLAGPDIDVHIIGFAKVMADIADGAAWVLLFALITLVLTLLAVRIYCQSWRVAFVPVLCSVIAVVWQLGALVLLRYGIDPIGLLVPFLIFAIGVSHGVQKISAVSDGAFAGLGSMEAARRTFRQLLAPAIVALLADLVGFVTILLIPVEVIREMAITASIGVAIVILTDLVLLPVLVSYVHFDAGYHARVARRQRWLRRVWHRLARVTRRRNALVVIVIAAVLGALGWWKGRETPIGDTQAGVPELRADSRYNRDNDAITAKFSIGVDVLTAIVQSQQPLCVSHDLMTWVDRFGWHMRNLLGVQEVITLPFIAKVAIAGWNEGSLKWRSIPREQTQLTQSTRYIETSTGLLNENCDVVPVLMFLTDHRAGTIERAVAHVKQWRSANPVHLAQLRLAAGNVGVMAATNETVEAKQLLILAGVFAAVIVMCLLTFHS
ncbi:MAG: MMPL family transporter, partial [Gammaproteobacteria bacterium]|nr:MMPL family transporter [Gammaproteobacteria bacterium]